MFLVHAPPPPNFILDPPIGSLLFILASISKIVYINVLNFYCLITLKLLECEEHNMKKFIKIKNLNIFNRCNNLTKIEYYVNV